MTTRTKGLLPWLFLGTLAATTAMAQTAAPGSASPTRAQVRMEGTEFLRTHRYDERADNWVLKSGVEAPTGVKSRAEVKAERDAFLRAHRWDEQAGQWIDLGPTPRDLDTLPRAQVKADTAQFLRSHRWDEQADQWVEKLASAPKR